MAVESRGRAVWKGDLFGGSGTVSLDSGLASDLPVTWAARTEKPDGKTTPEELIAGAHAACFSMALSNILAKAGSEAERLEVGATATFDKRNEGCRITAIDLEVRGTVPGMDAADFEKHAEAAKDGCPVSNAVKGNVALSVTASLA